MRNPDGILSGRGQDGLDQHLGVGGLIFAKATHQVAVGRAQWEKPVTGIHRPFDEGLDSGQGFVVGPSGEPAPFPSCPRRRASRRGQAFAKVIAQQAQPVLGKFAGEFALKGADTAPEGVYFTHHDGDPLERSIAVNFKNADISGHLLTFGLSEPGFTGCQDFQDAAYSASQDKHKGVIRIRGLPLQDNTACV